MRCFIAVNLPGEVKEKIGEATKNLEDRGMKKVASENLHLTLKFLGEVNEKRVEEVKKKLREIKFEKFLVSFRGVGCFPNRDFIKVVWLGVEEGRKNLIDLQKVIDEKLSEIGFKKERKFEPHLTVARVKFLRDKGKFVEELNKIRFEEQFEVESFELMESVLQKEGPTYKKVESFRLV